MSYKVKLQTFEGPFDLLVYLIENAQMSIYDIEIKSITGLQYRKLRFWAVRFWYLIAAETGNRWRMGRMVYCVSFHRRISAGR